MAVEKKYHEQFCQELIKHMADGESFASFAAYLYFKYKIAVSRKTLYEWVKTYPEWAEAKEVGQALSEAWWEQKAKDNLGGGQINAPLYTLHMVNRHGWRTKAKDENDQVTINNNPAPEKLSDEELNKQVEKRAAELGYVKK